VRRGKELRSKTGKKEFASEFWREGDMERYAKGG